MTVPFVARVVCFGYYSGSVYFKGFRACTDGLRQASGGRANRFGGWLGCHHSTLL